MKLARIGPAGHERPVLVDQSGRLRNLGDIIVDVNAATISREGLSRLAGLDPELLSVIGADGGRFGPGSRSTRPTPMRTSPATAC